MKNLKENYLNQANELLGRLDEGCPCQDEPCKVSYGKGKPFSKEELAAKGLNSLINDPNYVKSMEDDSLGGEEEVAAAQDNPEPHASGAEDEIGATDTALSILKDVQYKLSEVYRELEAWNRDYSPSDLGILQVPKKRFEKTYSELEKYLGTLYKRVEALSE